MNYFIYFFEAMRYLLKTIKYCWDSEFSIILKKLGQAYIRDWSIENVAAYTPFCV